MSHSHVLQVARLTNKHSFPCTLACSLVAHGDYTTADPRHRRHGQQRNDGRKNCGPRVEAVVLQVGSEQKLKDHKWRCQKTQCERQSCARPLRTGNDDVKRHKEAARVARLVVAVPIAVVLHLPATLSAARQHTQLTQSMVHGMHESTGAHIVQSRKKPCPQCEQQAIHDPARND